MPKPTPRQSHVLRVLRQWIEEHDGAMPTLRELARACGIRSPRTVTEHIIALRRKKLIASKIVRVRHTARDLDITEAGVVADEEWDGIHPGAALDGQVAALIRARMPRGG